MNLYHGSTFIVEQPNLDALNYKTDFGKGFYTTSSIEQATRWSKIKRERMQNTHLNIHANIKFMNIMSMLN